MEGVLVTARREGSTISHTVSTRADGTFSFSGDILSAGKHVLSVRAIGYEIDGAVPSVTISNEAARSVLKLRKVADIVPQVTNAEWIASMPGGINDKKQLLVSR